MISVADWVKTAAWCGVNAVAVPVDISQGSRRRTERGKRSLRYLSSREWNWRPERRSQGRKELLWGQSETSLFIIIIIIAVVIILNVIKQLGRRGPWRTTKNVYKKSRRWVNFKTIGDLIARMWGVTFFHWMDNVRYTAQNEASLGKKSCLEIGENKKPPLYSSLFPGNFS